MTINLTVPDLAELKPRITVFGVGGAGGNAVNNMIESRLEGVEFVVANTDAQALMQSAASRRIQMGTVITQGLGAGSHPHIGATAAEEALPEIIDHLAGSHMVFITAGMGGGTGTGAAPVIAQAAKEQGILTVGVVTKPFHFEGTRRMQMAERGIEELSKHVDTLIVIPNQNLFRVANEKTTFAAAFAMADQVLYSGVASITELMTKEGLINLDFADVRAIMSEMGKAMMGTGEASGEKRAVEAAEAAISNPLLDDVCMRGARGLLISITGGPDLTLYEVDEAATRIREEVDPDANIILGATFDEALEGTMRVSVVATGLNKAEEEARAAAAGHSLEEPKQPPLVRPMTARSYAYGGALPQQPLVKRSLDPRAAMAVNAQGAGAFPPPPAPAVEDQLDDEFEAEDADSDTAAEIYGEGEVAMPAEPARPSPPRSPRLPAPDEFPLIAQRQIAARQKEIEQIADEGQKRRRGLLDRLAGTFGRRDESPSHGREPQLGGERTDSRHRAAAAPASAPRPANVVAMQPQIDPSIDDDQLEIPAFLRRQAN
jgi:cell division protein FtsZ